MQIAICDDEREEILKIQKLIFNIQDNYFAFVKNEMEKR